MATYDEEVEITIPSISIEGEIEDDTPSHEITIPEVSIDELIVGSIDDPDYVFLYDDSEVNPYTDYTAEATDENANDTPLLPDPIGANDKLMICYPRPVDWVLAIINTAGVGSYTIKAQYYNGSGWQDLSILTTYGTDDMKGTGFYLLVFDKEAVSDWDSYTFNVINGCWLSISHVLGTLTTQPRGARIYVGEFIEETPVVYSAQYPIISSGGIIHGAFNRIIRG